MSPVFESMIKMTKNENGQFAMLVLDNVNFEDLQNLVQYIYTGSTLVPHDRMYGFLQLGNRFQVAGFANSRSVEPQRSEEPENEEEIAATISSNMMASEFAGTPVRKPLVELKTPMVEPRAPAVEKKPVPRMSAPAAVKKKRGRQSKAAKEGNSSEEAQQESPPKSDNQFRCQFCDKSYISKNSLYFHRTRSCSLNPDLKYYTCPVCNLKLKPSSKYQHTHKRLTDKNTPSTSKRDTI